MGVAPTTRVDSVSLIRGEARPAQPIEFVHHIGRVPRDVMLGGDPNLLLISDRFRSVLLTAGFTGWRTYPVAVRRKRGEPIPGYSGLSITGRAGPPDYSRSHLFMDQFVPDGPSVPTLRGESFAEDSWDGSDLFLLHPTTEIIVRATVRHALGRAKVTNVGFSRLDERQTVGLVLRAWDVGERPRLRLRIRVRDDSPKRVRVRDSADAWIDRRRTAEGRPFVHGVAMFVDGDLGLFPGMVGDVTAVPDLPDHWPTVGAGAEFQLLSGLVGVVADAVVLTPLARGPETQTPTGPGSG